MIVLSLEIFFEVQFMALVSISFFLLLRALGFIFFTRECKEYLVTESCSHISIYCSFLIFVKTVTFIYTGFFLQAVRTSPGSFSVCSFSFSHYTHLWRAWLCLGISFQMQGAAAFPAWGHLCFRLDQPFSLSVSSQGVCSSLQSPQWFCTELLQVYQCLF